MQEILRSLPPGARVLDLGCAAGSFDAAQSPFLVIRVDLDRSDAPPLNFTQADAARLPFAPHTFDAVISNHSLEHFANLDACLAEIGRVLKRGGALYIAVPDATTLSDRIYRWAARGGGHVNPFSSADALAREIEHATGLKHVATRTLGASLSCLNRENATTRTPRRLWLIGGGTPASLLLLTYFARLADRILHTRWSIYGWAMYFGTIAHPIDCRTWTNVCIRCGSGHAAEWLCAQNRVRRRLLFPTYRCPGCGATNLFTADGH